MQIFNITNNTCKTWCEWKKKWPILAHWEEKGFRDVSMMKELICENLQEILNIFKPSSKQRTRGKAK